MLKDYLENYITIDISNLKNDNDVISDNHNIYVRKLITKIMHGTNQYIEKYGNISTCIVSTIDSIDVMDVSAVYISKNIPNKIGTIYPIGAIAGINIYTSPLCEEGIFYFIDNVENLLKSIERNDKLDDLLLN